jgi:mono/diheme cytochrome c family protein
MRRSATVITALALLLGVVAGCGDDDDEGAGTTETTVTETEMETTGGTTGDAQAGEDVFATAGCGGCHTLEEAGSTGSVGPNLDGANLSFEQVKEQVENGGGAMPAFKGQLSDEEIANVSAFVAEASSN